jgi:hypothetical protein
MTPLDVYYSSYAGNPANPDLKTRESTSSSVLPSYRT